MDSDLVQESTAQQSRVGAAVVERWGDHGVCPRTGRIRGFQHVLFPSGVDLRGEEDTLRHKTVQIKVFADVHRHAEET